MLSKYKNSKIAIYGLGTETEKLLATIDKDFEIIGLLDGFREEGELYGKNIISMEEAIDAKVELILVVARPGSCKAIAKRIGNICISHGIDLLDVRGTNLCEQKRVTYDLKGIPGYTKKQLIQQIEAYDVVSVDLFDTLIMRNTLFSTDVFDIVDSRLREKNIMIADFPGKRLESEKNLAKTTSPTLREIYTYMIETYAVSGICAEQLAEMEWQVDLELVLPRREMCELIAEVMKRGKEVYIVSDIYYTKKQLVGLLDKCEMFSYTEILASCEYGTSKTQKLFQDVKRLIDERSCIHIGDDEVADIENAQKHGIAAFRIYSGLDIIESVGYLGLWESTDALANRIKIGMFVASVFNSPFLFESEACKISVGSSKDLGYLFFAPIICDFVLWFEHRVKAEQIHNIWFCARDGYLIKHLFELLTEDFSTVYFLTSRTAAIRAGIESIDDIHYVEGMKFSGTLKEQLSERFGIDSAPGKKNVLDYAPEILDKSSKCRKGYLKYIEQLHMQQGTVAFFDFVAKGTSQMFLERLVENHLKGFYFLQLEKEYMKAHNLDIESFYQESDSTSIYENYYILETILTAPMPSIKEIDIAGNPCYANETRRKEDIECFLSVQRGIVDYFKTYLSICPKEIRQTDKKIDELFLSFIQKVQILDADFLNLSVEDPFFNRMTDITDLV